MKSFAMHLLVENLLSISTHYSEGMAGRVLCEVWRRFEAAAGDACVVEVRPWGVTLHLDSRRSETFRHAELERIAVAVSLAPLEIDGHCIVVALSFQSDELQCALHPLHVDSMKYRLDMAAAALAYSALSSGGINFVEQCVVRPEEEGRELYRERLVRLIDADRCVLMPGTYLPALERLGLSRAFDWCVVRDTIERLRRHPGLVLGCNISGLSVCNDAWWHAVLDELGDNPDIASRLIVEITETALPHDVLGAFDMVSALQRAGCRVAVDDFGAGSSTIAFVRTIGADIVKVDGSYVRQRRDGPESADLLRHLIQLARHFAREIVVEGVECEADLQMAREAGSHWYQGFYFNVPGQQPQPLARPRAVSSLPTSEGAIQ